MAHRITFTSKYGAHETARLRGAPDRDSAAVWIVNQFPGSTVKAVEAIDEGAAYTWGEHDLGRFFR